MKMKTLKHFSGRRLEAGGVGRTDRQYTLMRLDEQTVLPDPFRQFSLWYEEAVKSGVDLPNAFALSTASDGGKPSCRMLLLKEADGRGFVFYTNSMSRKGLEMAENPRVSACFFWSAFERQVRIEGVVGEVSEKEADDYFASRPRASQLGAWASPQGRVVSGRGELEESFRSCEDRFSGLPQIPRPPHWKGYRITPSVFEFWQGRENRMHDRIRHRLDKNGRWIIERLAP